jgi:hypothetical protein
VAAAEQESSDPEIPTLELENGGVQVATHELDPLASETETVCVCDLKISCRL